jgi:hypothetical protein
MRDAMHEIIVDARRVEALVRRDAVRLRSVKAASAAFTAMMAGRMPAPSAPEDITAAVYTKEELRVLEKLSMEARIELCTTQFAKTTHHAGELVELGAGAAAAAAAAAAARVAAARAARQSRATDERMAGAAQQQQQQLGAGDAAAVCLWMDGQTDGWITSCYIYVYKMLYLCV